LEGTLAIGSSPAPEGTEAKAVIAAPETLEAVVICANLESAIAAAASMSALTIFVTVAVALSTRAWKSALPQLSGNVEPLVIVTVAIDLPCLSYASSSEMYSSRLDVSEVS
jgi:hypothetical protein